MLATSLRGIRSRPRRKTSPLWLLVSRREGFTLPAPGPAPARSSPSSLLGGRHVTGADLVEHLACDLHLGAEDIRPKETDHAALLERRGAEAN